LSLKNLNIQDPSKTVAIEDTPAGINSAKEAGMKVLAVTNTFSSGYLYEADAIASSLAEVNRKTLEDLIY
jgi:beta-phosphoglucomutase-like phosphatase (HAD superfamily)